MRLLTIIVHIVLSFKAFSIGHTSHLYNELLNKSFSDYLNAKDSSCELDLISSLKKNISPYGLKLKPFLKIINQKKFISSNLLSVISNLHTDYINLKKANDYKVDFKLLNDSKNLDLINDNDLYGLYRPLSFKNFCLYKNYRFIASGTYDPLNNEPSIDRLKEIIGIFNIQALSDGFISKEIFNNLEYLRKHSKLLKTNLNIRKLIKLNIY